MSRRHRRSPGKEQFWREAVTAWQKSGQSVRAFCVGRGLSEPSFYSWRRTLRKREPQRPTMQRQSRLVPLRIVAEPVMEVVLSAGVVVRVPAGADVVAVARLVAALRSASC
jgi:transposase-like protein